MMKYKLTDQNMRTRNTQWVLGEPQEILISGNTLCSPEVYHYYGGPLTAVLINPIHAEIENPRLFAVECDSVAWDGVKGGSKKQCLITELDVPRPSLIAATGFGILATLSVPQSSAFVHWAKNWLSGRDRSVQSAELTELAARSATESARLAVELARSARLAESARLAARLAELARLAARSAESARLAAMWAAAESARLAAMWSARSALSMARLAARSAESALSARSARSMGAEAMTWSAESARSAARSARSAARLAMLSERAAALAAPSAEYVTQLKTIHIDLEALAEQAFHLD